MNTVGELFQFATMREKTIVFGNLSRQPRVLYDLILSHHSQLQVIVVSRYYNFPSTADDKIRTLSHIQAKNIRCDLLMYLEPFPYETIHKPPGASSMVVFSSHLTFPIDDTWAKVCYFHYGDMTDAIEKTEKLLQLQDGSVQTNNIAKVRVDSVHVKHVGAPETFRYENSERSYFVVDLTSLTSPHAMLLRFWDAFDFMTRHLEKVERWMICFPEKNAKKAFEQFTQETIDALFCKPFENGNRLRLRHILALVPFYRSGVVDRTFNVPSGSFCDVKYVAPENLMDAFKAVVMHNVDHLVGSVYILK